MSDLIVRTAGRSVEETVDRLLTALERRSITVFARVDHEAGARAVGLELPGETVLVFSRSSKPSGTSSKNTCGLVGERLAPPVSVRF